MRSENMFIGILKQVEKKLIASQVWDTLEKIQKIEILYTIQNIDKQEEKRIRKEFKKQNEGTPKG